MIVSKIFQERDGLVDCVYLDLEKAFDKVSHGRPGWGERQTPRIDEGLLT